MNNEIVKKAFLDELQKIALSKNKIVSAVVHRIGDVQYAKSRKILKDGFDVRKIQQGMDAEDLIRDEAIDYARSMGDSGIKDLVRLTQKEFPKKIYMEKKALHPLMELSMAGAEVGSLIGAAIAIPVHKPGKLKDSLLEKAEISAVAGAALTPITATILRKFKKFKF